MYCQVATVSAPVFDEIAFFCAQLVTRTQLLDKRILYYMKA